MLDADLEYIQRITKIIAPQIRQIMTSLAFWPQPWPRRRKLLRHCACFWHWSPCRACQIAWQIPSPHKTLRRTLHNVLHYPTMSRESQINLIMSVQCHIYILLHSSAFFPAGDPMMSATMLFTLPLRPPHKRSHAAAPNPLCCPSTSHTDPANTTARLLLHSGTDPPASWFVFLCISCQRQKLMTFVKMSSPALTTW